MSSRAAFTASSHAPLQPLVPPVRERRLLAFSAVSRDRLGLLLAGRPGRFAVGLDVRPGLLRARRRRPVLGLLGAVRELPESHPIVPFSTSSRFAGGACSADAGERSSLSLDDLGQSPPRYPREHSSRLLSTREHSSGLLSKWKPASEAGSGLSGRFVKKPSHQALFDLGAVCGAVLDARCACLSGCPYWSIVVWMSAWPSCCWTK